MRISHSSSVGITNKFEDIAAAGDLLEAFISQAAVSIEILQNREPIDINLNRNRNRNRKMD